MTTSTETRQPAPRLATEKVFGSGLFCLIAALLFVPAIALAQPLASDDFDTCGLDGSLWTVVDPMADGVVAVTGSGSGDAKLLMSVPAGAAHQPFGANDALRVLQNVTDGDLSAHAKFDSAVVEGFQMQGILIEQDDDDYIRFDVYHSGSSVKIFAATFTGGSVSIKENKSIPNFFPIILSVNRTGDDWTLEYTYDEVTYFDVATFNHAITVNQIGPFAGNAPSGGVTPPFTAEVDYFFNSAAPIVPEDQTPFGAPAILTKNIVGMGSITVDPDQPEYYCDEVVTLTAVNEPGWLFNGWTGDVTGTQNPIQVTMTSDAVVTASFVQDGTALEISNVQITPDVYSATITWTTNEPSSSEVAFGLTSSYELGTEIDPTLTTSHSIVISGLDADTTYFCEIYSEEASGNSDVEGGLTFTTDPIQLSNLLSDDFNACTLDSQLWTYIDPVGDATLAVEGTGSDDARVVISLPAGTSHDVWTSGNMAPRLMQAADNTDFEVSAKFDSVLAGKFAMQGIIVEEDADNFVRFDFYSNGNSIKVFSAIFSTGGVEVQQNQSISAGVSLYLRVAREGDLFTQSYSYDGVNWFVATSFVHPMTVTSVGPFIGSAGSNAPAFEGRIDYFFNSLDPISPEDGPSAGTPTTLTVNPSTNGTIAVDPLQPSYFCDELVTLTALPDPGYVFSGWTGDLSGLNDLESLTMDVDHTVGANFAEDTTPLTISNVEVEPGDDFAIVRWTTSKVATSRVDYGLDSTYALGAETEENFVTSHEIQLGGLTADTTYHFEVSSVGGLGDSTASGDLTFTTTIPGGFVSDDFNAFNLNPIWTFVNPIGDATISFAGTNTANAHLVLDLPAGTEHDVWKTGNDSARVMQPAANVDFSAEVKFESLITERYQMQGILIEQDADTYLRFDFYHNGSSAYALAAAFAGGGVSVKANEQVPSGFPWYLRVVRVGNQWTQQYSFNGSNWNDVVTFTHEMNVTSMGPFVANAGSNPPAFTGIVDYFFNTEAPIVPEDGTVVEDTFPPSISNVQTSAGEDTIALTWNTDEPATTIVRYGETPAYELGQVSEPAFRINHVAIVSDLQPETEYFLEIACEDSNNNTGVLQLVVSTGEIGSSAGPTIDIWYGTDQEFYSVGMPQPWANILGNVSDTEGVVSLTYSLNGGSAIPLNVGPDNRRLFAPGDFNIDLDVDDLLVGANQVIITAIDGIGNESATSMTVTNSAGPTWPETYTLDWQSVASIDEQAQVIDGKWGLVEEGVRPIELGYDRLIGIGDLGWVDYEVTVPVTVHFVDSANAYTPQSGGPAVGIIMRWPGHSIGSNQQPYHEFNPLGSIGWFRYNQAASDRFQILGNNGSSLGIDNSDPLVVGVEYMFKMRVESVGNRDFYKLKAWPSSESEPTQWRITGSQSNANDPMSGSLCLVAHHIDATFGDVVVTPGPFADAEPLEINNIQYTAGDSFVVISFDTNYLTTADLDYGLTNSYELGTFSSATPSTSHTVTITDLASETAYHYMISVSGGSQMVSSSDLIFNTAPPGGTTSSQDSDIVSDDFNTFDLDPVWELVDPVGDSTFELVGEGTGDAHLEITVPAGVPHDVWTNGNDSARVMQSISNTNFEIEAKFDSQVAERYQIQGILIEQDALNFLRFDTVRTSSSVRIFAAAFSNGLPDVQLNQTIDLGSSIYFRLSRTGDTWTFSRSDDGQDYQVAVVFNHALTVNKVGPFAGNAGGAATPAFTARVDYFFNGIEPIDPEDQ